MANARQEPCYLDRMLFDLCMNGVIRSMEQANDLLGIVMTDYFEDADQKPISSYDASRLCTLLHSVQTELTNAIAEYSLTAVRENTYFEKRLFEVAQNAVIAKEVDDLMEKADAETRNTLRILPDADALEMLRRKFHE